MLYNATYNLSNQRSLNNMRSSRSIPCVFGRLQQRHAHRHHPGHYAQLLGWLEDFMERGNTC